MAEILILEEILNKSVERIEQGVLFGKPKYVSMAGRDCDLLFHYLAMPFERADEESLLVIPVLKLLLPEQRDLAISTMNKLHKKYPSVKTFAVRTREEKGLTLDFYDTEKVKYGQGFEKRNYNIATREKFRAFFKNWRGIERRLESLRKKINEKYS